MKARFVSIHLYAALKICVQDETEQGTEPILVCCEGPSSRLRSPLQFYAMLLRHVFFAGLQQVMS